MLTVQYNVTLICCSHVLFTLCCLTLGSSFGGGADVSDEVGYKVENL